jgi:VanZ family protein
MGRYLPPLLIYALIFALSTLPASALPSGIPDFIPHFIEYGLLSFFIARAFSGRIDMAKVALIIVISMILGILDEFHQSFVPGRFCSVADLLVDFAGICAAVFLYSRIKRGPRPVD